jgi:hypothetical protein
MIRRIASVWIAITAASAVAASCFALAGAVGRMIVYDDVELPLISKAFYPESLLIYLYPIPLGIWALAHTIRSREDRESSLLIITTTLSITMAFIAVFLLALVSPYISGFPSVFG